MLLLRVVQDVSHSGGGTTVPLAASTSRAPTSYGRFWVSTEALQGELPSFTAEDLIGAREVVLRDIVFNWLI